MIRVKMMRRNETAIIDNGKVYLFDLSGNCIGEDIGNITGYMDGALDLPIISVLSGNNACELGFSFPGQELKRYKSSLKSAMIAVTLQTSGFVKMLHRTGEQHGVKFNQLLFVFREDTDIHPLLQRLQCTEA